MKLYRKISNSKLYYIDQPDDSVWEWQATPYFRGDDKVLVAKPKTYKDGSTRFEGYIEVYDARRG